MADADETQWWSGLPISRCEIPFLPPAGCVNCLRRMVGTGDGSVPVVERDGSCASRVDPEDPSMGLPW